MAVKELIALLPRFFEDRDEDWICYLDEKQQKFLRDKRAKIFAKKEKFEDFEDVFRREVTINRALNPAEREEKTRMYNATKEKYNNKLNLEISKILDKVRTYKTEALKNKREASEREAAEILAKRKQTADYPDLIDIAECDIELAQDDYLPNYFPREPKKDAETPLQPARTTPVADPPESAKSSGKRKEPDSSFTEGLGPEQIDILTDLKSQIIRYDCRDQVLKTIASYKNRARTIMIMELASKFVQNQSTGCT